MKQNYTHLSIVMDRSGSMSGIAKDMEGGIKSFIENQKKVEGEATITLAKFDDQYDVVYDFTPISQVNDFSLNPRGGTALLDAMGRTMESVRERIKAMNSEDQPAKVIFIFITDGEENSSHTYDRNRIFEMISDLRNSNEKDENQPDEDGTVWEFVFLGANQDAIQAGGSFGIRAQASMTYSQSAQGAQNMFDSLNATTTCYRCAVPGAAYAFTDEDREKQQEIDPSIKSTTNVKKTFPAVPDIRDTNLAEPK